MTALIILIIMLIISIAACSWASIDHKRNVERLGNPSRRTKKQAKVIRMKMELKSLEIDEVFANTK